MLETNFGKYYEKESKIAKEHYEKTVQDLLLYRQQQEIKTNLENELRFHGLKLSSVSKVARSIKEKHVFDKKILQKKEETLLKNLNRSRKDYSVFCPEVIDYNVSIEESSEEEFFFKTEELLDVNTLDSLRFYDWPEESLSVPLRSSLDSVGCGPGEERLATLFGGKTMGGMYSFDLLVSHKKFEVKYLENFRSAIRCGSKGNVAMYESFQKMADLISQLKSFVNNVLHSPENSPKELKVIEYVSSFLEEKGEEISSCTVLWFGTLVKLCTLLKEVSKLITVGNQMIKNSAKQLSHEAFVDATKFINEFISVDINKVFSNTDGVFLTFDRGYIFVEPVDYDAFSFAGIANGRLNLRFDSTRLKCQKA